MTEYYKGDTIQSQSTYPSAASRRGALAADLTEAFPTEAIDG